MYLLKLSNSTIRVSLQTVITSRIVKQNTWKFFLYFLR